METEFLYEAEVSSNIIISDNVIASNALDIFYAETKDIHNKGLSVNNRIFSLISALDLEKLFISSTTSNSIFYRFKIKNNSFEFMWEVCLDYDGDGNTGCTLQVYIGDENQKSTSGSIEEIYLIISKMIFEDQESSNSYEDLNKSHYLGKFVESNIRLKDSDGTINGGAVDVNRIPGFSTNKIPDSVPEDLNIKFKDTHRNNYVVEWYPGINGIMPPNDHFDIIDDTRYYFLRIEDIEFSDGSYKHADNLNKDYNFSLKVIHKPLVSNYWHFEFHIDSEHGIVDKNKSA